MKKEVEKIYVVLYFLLLFLVGSYIMDLSRSLGFREYIDPVDLSL